jgi:hypothetical protein
MPKLPRISSKEAIRALERLGLEQVRQTGSHVVMKFMMSNKSLRRFAAIFAPILVIYLLKTYIKCNYEF